MRFSMIMPSNAEVIRELQSFRYQVENAAGHAHLYEVFHRTVSTLSEMRKIGDLLNPELGREILLTAELLVKENNKGRRPWPGNWETYFERCMENARILLKEFAAFTNAYDFYPPGFCNQFLDSFLLMDRHQAIYSAQFPAWSGHFARLAALSAELFCLSADGHAQILEDILETPDDATFTYLLTGFAKSRSPQGSKLLQEFTKDPEGWVRDLAYNLRARYP